ncbi:MAG: hypothetical protein KDK45_15615, partial [Leptospiraceae bacterium]|nr:hypothetical protein [Leptospiraceae bacterium]
YNVSALRQAVDKLNNEGKDKQIYKLKNVKFMEYYGLSIFVKQMSILKKNNEVLKLACVGDGIKNLFRWTTLNMYVEIHSTEYEAIQSFNK